MYKSFKVGLALEGGGAKGSYEIGSYIALRKLGIKFDLIAGTSIGAMNAALIVQDNIRLAKKLWLDASSEIIGLSDNFVNLHKDFKLNKEILHESFEELKNIIKNKGLDITNYRKIIDEYIDEDKIRKSKTDLGLVTIRLKDLKPLELTLKDIEKGKLGEYILASSYLPFFKMNKIIDDSYYLDGGFTNNLPISILEKNGCDKIYAIRINGTLKKKVFSKVDIEEIVPTKSTGSIIFFNNEDILNNYYMGYYDTLLYFGKLDGYKYYFKKYKNYDKLIKNIDTKLISLLKIKYRTFKIKNIILKSIEDILEDNNINYYKVYKINKIIKYIKRKQLKSKNKLINDFVYKLNY